MGSWSHLGTRGGSRVFLGGFSRVSVVLGDVRPLSTVDVSSQALLVPIWFSSAFVDIAGDFSVQIGPLFCVFRLSNKEDKVRLVTDIRYPCSGLRISLFRNKDIFTSVLVAHRSYLLLFERTCTQFSWVTCFSAVSVVSASYSVRSIVLGVLLSAQYRFLSVLAHTVGALMFPATDASRFGHSDVSFGRFTFILDDIVRFIYILADTMPFHLYSSRFRPITIWFISVSASSWWFQHLLIRVCWFGWSFAISVVVSWWLQCIPVLWVVLLLLEVVVVVVAGSVVLLVDIPIP